MLPVVEDYFECFLYLARLLVCVLVHAHNVTHPSQSACSDPCDNVEGRRVCTCFFSLRLSRYVGQHVCIGAVYGSARVLI